MLDRAGNLNTLRPIRGLSVGVSLSILESRLSSLPPSRDIRSGISGWIFSGAELACSSVLRTEEGVSKMVAVSEARPAVSVSSSYCRFREGDFTK